MLAVFHALQPVAAWCLRHATAYRAPRLVSPTHVLFLINFQHPDVVLVVRRAAVGAFCHGVVFRGVVVQLLPAKGAYLVLALAVQSGLVGGIQLLEAQRALVHLWCDLTRTRRQRGAIGKVIISDAAAVIVVSVV